MTMTGPEHDRACQACGVIDRADGAEDGRLYRSFTSQPRSGHPLARSAIHLQDRVTDGISNFAGSIPFIYLHLAWFGLWIAANLGWFGSHLKFDPFPFGLLTMIVSLEAIFLSLFVLISQNRQAAREKVRNDIEYDVNIKAELEIGEILQRLTRIEQSIGDLKRK